MRLAVLVRTRLEPWLAPARRRFAGLEPREQRALVLLAGALAVAGFWWLILQPLYEGRMEARSRYIRATQTLSWIQQNAPAVRAARANTSTRAASDSGWASRISSSAAAHDLSLKGFTPEGSNTVRVVLENQPFAGVLTWLQSLRREEGVSASSISISRGERPGGVNVRMTLTRNG